MQPHFKIAVLIIFLLSVSSLQIDGQSKKKPSPTPRPKVEATPKPEIPIMTQKATTDDGKFVVLKSDGTWIYDPEPRPLVVAPVVSTPTTGVLRIKAAVVTRGGNVLPAARGTFELLDEDLRVLLRPEVEAKLKSGNKLAPYMSSTNSPLIKSHIKYKATSDFEGNVTFTDVTPGVYFVYFFDFIGQNSILWSVKVDVKAGDNFVVLDQNNVLETFSR